MYFTLSLMTCIIAVSPLFCNCFFIDLGFISVSKDDQPTPAPQYAQPAPAEPEAPEPLPFSCYGRFDGHYADIQSECQTFHICQQNRIYSLSCPNGLFFDQRYHICNPPHDVLPCSASEFYYGNSPYQSMNSNYDENGSDGSNYKDPYSNHAMAPNMYPTDYYPNMQQNREYENPSHNYGNNNNRNYQNYQNPNNYRNENSNGYESGNNYGNQQSYANGHEGGYSGQGREYAANMAMSSEYSKNVQQPENNKYAQQTYPSNQNARSDSQEVNYEDHQQQTENYENQETRGENLYYNHDKFPPR